MNKPSKEELDAMLTRWKRNKETAEDHIFIFKLLWAYCDGELVEKNQWISVKDRLPEYGDEYNVVWEFEFSNPVVTTMLFGFLKKSKIK